MLVGKMIFIHNPICFFIFNIIKHVQSNAVLCTKPALTILATYTSHGCNKREKLKLLKSFETYETDFVSRWGQQR
jgi:hypothetical protein